MPAIADRKALPVKRSSDELASPRLGAPHKRRQGFRDHERLPAPVIGILCKQLHAVHMNPAATRMSEAT